MCLGFFASKHVVSWLQTRDQSRAPRTGRQGDGPLAGHMESRAVAGFLKLTE